MSPHARAEWHPLRRVALRAPQMEAFFGLLEPYAALYERVFSLKEARREHAALVAALRAGFGVRVEDLDDLLARAAERRAGVARELRSRAAAAVTFRGPGASRARREFDQTLRQLDPEQLIETLVLRPEFRFVRSAGARAVRSFATLRQPLTNLFFLRDQQALTDRGLVLGRPATPQRRPEVDLTGFVWRSSGMRPLAPIRRGTFEGGDFLPAGAFALVGLGDRTNATGVRELLAGGLGFDEVGVVHRPRHPLLSARDAMVNMHLDTYLNFPGEGIAVGHRGMLERARVDLYRRDGGIYRPAGTTHLLGYLERTRGFRLVEISTLEQLCYATNFLTIRDRSVVVPDVGGNARKVLANLARLAAAAPRRYGRLHERAAEEYRQLGGSGRFFPFRRELRDIGLESVRVPLANLTGAFGGAHCLTAVLARA
ncbi:MAG: arginine deiminase family protein [Thermoplasmata archaeon]